MSATMGGQQTNTGSMGQFANAVRNNPNAMASGSPKGFQKLPNFTPEMMQLFQSLFGQLGPGSRTARLAGGDEGIFNEIEAPAYSQFTSGLGGLASKFSGMGGTGSRKSSGFQNTANQALSEFSQGLASQRQGLSRQAMQDLFSMSNMLLNQRPYEYAEKEKEPSFWESLFGGLGNIGGNIFGNVATSGTNNFLKKIGWQ